MDETCPLSTGGGTRRVQSVREGVGGGGMREGCAERGTPRRRTAPSGKALRAGAGPGRGRGRVKRVSHPKVCISDSGGCSRGGSAGSCAAGGAHGRQSPKPSRAPRANSPQYVSRPPPWSMPSPHGRPRSHDPMYSDWSKRRSTPTASAVPCSALGRAPEGAASIDREAGGAGGGG